MRRLCQSISLGICGLPLLFSLPDWTVASWVGSCWGALLLTGLTATWAKNRTAWCLYCLVISMVAHASMRHLIDMGNHAAWLIIAALLSSGWLVGISLLPWRDDRRVPGHVAQDRDLFAKHYRFSVWDIFCVTSLVALIIATVPHIENPFDVMCQLGPALGGGIALSVLALWWAWNDTWSLANLAAMLVSLLAALLLLWPWSGMERDQLAIIGWIVAGPLSVMAAQFIVVLLWSATLRPTPNEPTNSSQPG